MTDRETAERLGDNLEAWRIVANVCNAAKNSEILATDNRTLDAIAEALTAARAAERERCLALHRPGTFQTASDLAAAIRALGDREGV